MNILRSSRFCAAIASASAFVFTTTFAQAPEPPREQTPEQQPESAPLTEEKLDQFANAFVMIESIHAEAEATLSTTQDPSEIDHVKQQAEAAMIDAVERSGLAIEEFNEIMVLAQLSPELNEELTRRVEQRRAI